MIDLQTILITKYSYTHITPIYATLINGRFSPHSPARLGWQSSLSPGLVHRDYFFIENSTAKKVIQDYVNCVGKNATDFLDLEIEAVSFLISIINRKTFGVSQVNLESLTS